MFTFGFLVGLIVGWNFLSQPEFIRVRVEKVKNWMDVSNIIFYEQGKNMNWSKFLLGIRSDFKKFVHVNIYIIIVRRMDSMGFR